MATSTSDEDSLEYVEEVVYEEVTDEEEDGDGQGELHSMPWQ